MLTDRHTRRGFLGLSGLSALSVLLAACGGGDAAPAAETAIESPEEALERLLQGNARYVADKSLPINEGKARREKVATRQRPFATIFSCVDSRVPPELVFDRGLGDLFVVRTAGEVVDTAVLGSIEYGIGELEIPLVVVLGHSACGAVKATVASLATGEKPEAEIAYLVDGIAPAVTKAKEKLKPAPSTKKKKTAATTTTVAEGEAAASKESPTTTVAAADADPNAALVTATIEVNVELVVERLKALPMLAEKIKKERLLIAGGVYDLESGEVKITVGMPEELQKKLDEAAAKKSGAKEGEATTVAEGSSKEATTTTKKEG